MIKEIEIQNISKYTTKRLKTVTSNTDLVNNGEDYSSFLKQNIDKEKLLDIHYGNQILMLL